MVPLEAGVEVTVMVRDPPSMMTDCWTWGRRSDKLPAGQAMMQVPMAVKVTTLAQSETSCSTRRG